MPNSDRMGWPYPAENQTPWFEPYEDQISAQDASAFAARDDRNLFASGGGRVAWDAGTSTLTWDAVFSAVTPLTGHRVDVAAGTTTLDNGGFLYIDIPRGATSPQTVAAYTAARIPSSDTAYVLCSRVGDTLYWRKGLAVTESIQYMQAMDAAVSGDTWTNVGSIWIAAGTLLASSSVFAGDALATNAAEVQLRRDAGDALIASWYVLGALAEDTLGGEAAISLDGWHNIRLRGAVPASEAVLKGIRLLVV